MKAIFISHEEHTILLKALKTAISIRLSLCYFLKNLKNGGAGAERERGVSAVFGGAIFIGARIH